LNKTQLFYYALKEIGLTQLADYAIYQIQKKSGSLARKTPFLGVPRILSQAKLTPTFPARFA
jgi:hypothetical protein